MNQDDINFEGMEDFETLINKSLRQPTRGDLIKGVVVKVSSDSVIVDFGYKTEGIVDRSEFDTIDVDDAVELTVISFFGGSYVKLSKSPADSDSAWDALKVEGIGSTVSVKITGKVDKGYIGKVGDIDAFIPLTHIEAEKADSDKKIIGTTYKASILKFGEGKRKSILVSPRNYLKIEKDKKKAEVFSSLKVGDKVKGTVKVIKVYGAFIDLGGIDGFLHKNDIAWQRIHDVAKYLEVGDTVETVITDVKEDLMKITLGMKQFTANPWEAVKETAPIDATILGTVVTRKRSGYVVELDNHVDGIIFYEEISWLKNARNQISVKDRVECKVIGYDETNNKVILSLKAMHDNPWKSITKDHPEGSIVKGKVKSITDFGIFLDFGSIIDGLIRNSDISWDENIGNVNDLYKVGDEIEAKIMRVDEERERISLSVKHLEDNPWADVGKLFPQGKVVTAPIVSISKTGMEVELAMKLKGFISVQDLDLARPSLDKYKEGETVTAQVFKVDFKNRLISLSIKRYLQDAEFKDTKEYMKKLTASDSGFSFGSILKDKFEEK